MFILVFLVFLFFVLFKFLLKVVDDVLVQERISCSHILKVIKHQLLLLVDVLVVVGQIDN